jgi:hypothetical protein
VRRKALLEWTVSVLVSWLLGILIFLVVDDDPLWKTLLAAGLYGISLGTGLTIIHRFAN